MSIKLISAVWDSGPTNLGERMVMLSLADQANDEGYCWPKMKTIAERCCMTRPGVAGIIKRLTEGGWLRVERRMRQNGTFSSNGYWLNAQRLGLVNEDDTALSTSFTPSVNEDDTTVSTRMTPRVNDVDTSYPSSYPSIEPSGGKRQPSPPPAKELTPEKEAHAHMINALGEVCGMSPYLNFDKLSDPAAQLIDAGYTEEQVRTHYARPDGWWYQRDWRGQKGEYPRPGQVIETIYGAIEQSRPAQAEGGKLWLDHAKVFD